MTIEEMRVEDVIEGDAMTDAEIRMLRREWVGPPGTFDALTELLAYRRAARKLKRAWYDSDHVAEAVVDGVLAVLEGKP